MHDTDEQFITKNDPGHRNRLFCCQHVDISGWEWDGRCVGQIRIAGCETNDLIMCSL